MKKYRITKYNPLLRDSDGIYTLNEWTSFSDVGKNISGNIFTYDDYLNVENSYLQVIEYIINIVGNPSFTVTDLEIHTDDKCEIDDDNKHSSKLLVTEGLQLKVHAALNLCRLVLREEVWCKLEFNCDCYFHFGYDYYMYVGVPDNALIDQEFIKMTGLFIESYDSPYE